MASEEIEDTRGQMVRSASTITPLTLLSRVTGYVRDKAVAVTLGAGLRTDAFVVAFRIPNMLREIVGEGAMSSAVIPVYAEVAATCRRRCTFSPSSIFGPLCSLRGGLRHSPQAQIEGGTMATKTKGRSSGGRSSGKSSGKRELINTGTDKRFVRRGAKGQFKESDDVGRSLRSDRRQHAKTESKPGQGDRGDRKR